MFSRISAVSAVSALIVVTTTESACTPHYRLSTVEPRRQRRRLFLREPDAVVDALDRQAQRPRRDRQLVRREERLDVVARAGVAERREAGDERRVAAGDRDLRLERGPLLFQERPRAVARRGVREKLRQENRRVLRAQLGRERHLQGAIDERGVAKIGEPVQIAVMLLGRRR